MIAVAQQPRIMTDDEVLDMAEKLEDMRHRGWSMTQLADDLGYSNPSVLYAAKRSLRGIEFARYRKLCGIHAAGTEPPAARRPRDNRQPSIPEADLERFLGVMRALQEKGVTQELQAKAAGYGSSAGYRMAIRSGRVPMEVHERIMELAIKKGVLNEPARPQPAPDRHTRARWGAVDYFKAVGSNLDSCAALMEEASRELANPLTRPGYERFVTRLRELHEEVRAVVG
jgi:hypothetical protein